MQEGPFDHSGHTLAKMATGVSWYPVASVVTLVKSVSWSPMTRVATIATVTSVASVTTIVIRVYRGRLSSAWVFLRCSLWPLLATRAHTWPSIALVAMCIHPWLS